MKTKGVFLLATVLLTFGPALAQSSLDFEVESQAFNAGGHPAGGQILTSGSFRVTLDAIGGSVTGLSLAGGPFTTDVGLAVSYPPTGEIAPFCDGTAARCAVFTTRTQLVWPAERSTGVYHVYRGTLASLPALAFGVCWRFDVPGELVVETATPAAGTGFFYLVTAENRLGEEGTKGYQSNGTERANAAPCP
jgi:hypothetical protein